MQPLEGFSFVRGMHICEFSCFYTSIESCCSGFFARHSACESFAGLDTRHVSGFCVRLKQRFAIALLCLWSSSVSAQIQSCTIAEWTFENNPISNEVTAQTIGPISPQSGQGELVAWHNASNTAWNTAVVGNGSSRALSADKWTNGDYFQFKVPTTNSGEFSIRWHQRRSSTAPGNFALQYSTNGSDFQVLTNYVVTTNVWYSSSTNTDSSFSNSFTNLTAATNLTNLIFRLVATSVGGSQLGTSRIDNIKITHSYPATKHFITVAGQQVEVDRWGNGPKAAIFFSHSGALADIFRKNACALQSLVGSEYSIFTWNYPSSASLFSGVNAALWDWMDYLLPPETRLLYPGVASSVLSQLRQLTGIQDFCLVGNSMGAGVILSDYETLVQDPHCKILLISPTELFLPKTLPAILEKTLMVSDPANEVWVRQQTEMDLCANNSRLPFPAGNTKPGHIIIQDESSIKYAFQLLAYWYQQPGESLIFSPKLGDKVWLGGNTTLNWTASFVAGPVTIELLRAGQISSTIADSVPNSGKYNWLLTNAIAEADDYTLRIRSCSDPSQAGTSSPFSIRNKSLVEALDAPQLSFSSGGNVPWYGQTEVTADGVDAARSGRISNNQTSYMQTKLHGPGIVSFDWRVSSESARDFLTFYFPGVSGRYEALYYGQSGRYSSWWRPSIQIPEGEVTVGWYYTKDSVGWAGYDGAWVDNISYQPLVALLPMDGLREAGYGAPVALQTCGTGFGAGSNGSSLANAYALSDGKDLYLFIGGNLQGNSSKLMIFFDSTNGGQNTLNFTGGLDSTSNLSSLQFDAAFEADYFVDFRWGGTGETTSAEINTLGASGASVKTSSIITNGRSSAGVLWGANNGASTGPTEAAPGNSATVATGFEFKIPLSLLGNPTSDIKICAFISSGAEHFVSNQFLAGLPIGTANLGTAAEARNLSVHEGSQYFTVAGPEDGNGIPFVWWLENFGTKDGVSAQADSDGDGYTNAQEFALGTKPNDAASFFRLHAPSAQSGTVTVSWDAVAGKTYQVTSSGSLNTATWQNVGAPVTAATSGVLSMSDTPGTPQRFYRVILVQ